MDTSSLKVFDVGIPQNDGHLPSNDGNQIQLVMHATFFIVQASGKYTAQVTKIEYLTDGNALTTAFQAGCPAAGDQGVQRITVSVTSTATTHQMTTNVVMSKRDDRCPDAAQRPAEVVDGQRC